MSDIRIGVHHVDGPSMYLMKIPVGDVILRLNHEGARNLASALINDVSTGGMDARNYRISWTLFGRGDITVEIEPRSETDRWGNTKEMVIETRTLTDDWGPKSWQHLVVMLKEFAP